MYSLIVHLFGYVSIKPVAQGQYMVSDTRCPALYVCEYRWWLAGQRPRRGWCPVEQGDFRPFGFESTIAPLHNMEKLTKKWIFQWLSLDNIFEPLYWVIPSYALNVLVTCLYYHCWNEYYFTVHCFLIVYSSFGSSKLDTQRRTLYFQDSGVM